MANRSPPAPFIVGSTTARTAAAVTAASIALPPDCSTRSPAAVASGWLVAMAPFLASTAERVPRVLPAGRSPAGCCMRVDSMMRAATAIRMGGDYTRGVSIRDRVARLVAEMPQAPQYPTQGATVFVDLERREVQRGYTPLHVIRSLLAGRGANMFYLYRLLDESLSPLHPDVPLIFGSGVLTGIVPSAARGNATSWSLESGVLMDSNAGDYF